MRIIAVLVLSIVLFSCKNGNKIEIQGSLNADTVINKAIESAGGNRFDQSFVSFDFRDKAYAARRYNGVFELSRSWIDESNDTISDFLNNTGFIRKVNNIVKKVEDSMATKYAASVNSVHYFSVLPFGLNDPAVKKSLLEEEEINQKIYYKVKVTFNEEGGGEDFEDIFIYWINKENFKLDYLAYSYNEDDGVGLRFREAYNERFSEGIRFVDYNNFKPKSDTINLQDLAQAFNLNELELLSKIELENVSVDLINF